MLTACKNAVEGEYCKLIIMESPGAGIVNELPPASGIILRQTLKNLDSPLPPGGEPKSIVFSVSATLNFTLPNVVTSLGSLIIFTPTSIRLFDITPCEITILNGAYSALPLFTALLKAPELVVVVLPFTSIQGTELHP